MTNPEKLLRATEHLIIKEGAHAATLRRIAATAKSNMSLISYHFGGIEQLLAALMHKNIDRFLDYEAGLLDDLLKQGKPDLEALVKVFLLPLRLPAIYHSDARCAEVLHAIYRHAKEPVRREADEKLVQTVEPLLRELSLLLPELDRRTLLWRLNAISAASMNLAPRAPSRDLLVVVSDKMISRDEDDFDEMLRCGLSILTAPGNLNG